MRICKHCGTKNFDIATTCEKCGQLVETPLDPVLERVGKLEYVAGAVHKNNGVCVAAKVFLILRCVGSGLLALCSFLLWLISLVAVEMYAGLFSGSGIEFYLAFVFWYFLISLIITVAGIWVTVHYCRETNAGRDVSVTFKVCILLLIDFIAGILMLCDAQHG